MQSYVLIIYIFRDEYSLNVWLKKNSKSGLLNLIKDNKQNHVGCI